MNATGTLRNTLLAAGMLVSFLGMSQTGKVWMTISEDAMPYKGVNGKYNSIESSMDGLMKTHKVTNVEYIFSNSRNPELQRVVEVTCECDAVDLYADAMNKVGSVEDAAIAPSEYTPLQEPNDYSLTFASDYALDLINAQTAWTYTTGSPDVVLAISDQNFYANHEELTGKVKYYNTNNTLSRTHGTAVATTAAGNTDNSLGKASIGYNSSVALYRMNYNEMLSASYAGARVINMSWSSSCSYNKYVQAAINEVYNNGTFIVASAGNGGTCGNAGSKVYPASYNHVFSVTSVGPQDNHERFIGNANSTHQHNDSVDLCAPGYDVALTPAPGTYVTGNGSSFAAPYVTGTVGLMLALNPALTPDEIEAILKETAANIYDKNAAYVGKLGAGRLDAGAAVKAVWDIMNPPVVDDNDGNNGHGNDEDGVDSSNPGQGNGNHGNNNEDNNENNDQNNGVGVGSMKSAMSATEMNVYPNPAVDHATVRWTGEASAVVVMNAAGQIVAKAQVEETNEYEINNLTTGMYVVNVITENQVLTKKLIVR